MCGSFLMDLLIPLAWKLSTRFSMKIELCRWPMAIVFWFHRIATFSSRQTRLTMFHRQHWQDAALCISTTTVLTGNQYFRYFGWQRQFHCTAYNTFVDESEANTCSTSDNRRLVDKYTIINSSSSLEVLYQLTRDGWSFKLFLHLSETVLRDGWSFKLFLFVCFVEDSSTKILYICRTTVEYSTCLDCCVTASQLAVTCLCADLA